MNPRIGSGMQQAHAPSVEKAVEVVRNHEDGTRRSLAPICRRPPAPVVLLREEPPVTLAAGSGHRTVMSMEGRSLENPEGGAR
jgi:hypothetical protein